MCARITYMIIIRKQYGKSRNKSIDGLKICIVPIKLHCDVDARGLNCRLIQYTLNFSTVSLLFFPLVPLPLSLARFILTLTLGALHTIR